MMVWNCDLEIFAPNRVLSGQVLAKSTSHHFYSHTDATSNQFQTVNTDVIHLISLFTASPLMVCIRTTKSLPT